MQIENAFAMPLGFEMLEGIDNESLKKFCLERQHDLKGQSNLIGWGTEPIKSLANVVLEQVNEMHTACGLNYKQRFSHVWTNVNRPNPIRTPHTHPCFFTSIYYVTSGSSLNLLNPNNNIENLIDNTLVKNYNPFNQLIQRIYPKPGLLITHPAWLLHYVEEDNNPSEDRISITFNTVIAK